MKLSLSNQAELAGYSTLWQRKLFVNILLNIRRIFIKNKKMTSFFWRPLEYPLNIFFLHTYQMKQHTKITAWHFIIDKIILSHKEKNLTFQESDKKLKSSLLFLLWSLGYNNWNCPKKPRISKPSMRFSLEIRF